MLVIAWPAMGYLFVPVLILEYAVAHRILGSAWRRSIPAVVAANAASTLVGVPLSWAVLVAGAIATSGLLSVLPEAVLDSPARWIMAPFAISWLGPGVERHPWWIPAAFLGLLVPFFFMSVWVERVVMRGPGSPW